mgnify:CR=1 FL=1
MRTSLTQYVKQFFDEEALIEQTFLIDNDFDGEPWVVVENNTQELSLSLENWKKLIEMANIVINRYEKKNN